MQAVAIPTRYTDRIKRRKRRDEKIRAMYNKLYHQERKRIDDVEKEVADFWELSVRTVQDIIRGRN